MDEKIIEFGYGAPQTLPPDPGCPWMAMSGAILLIIAVAAATLVLVTRNRG